MEMINRLGSMAPYENDSGMGGMMKQVDLGAAEDEMKNEDHHPIYE